MPGAELQPLLLEKHPWLQLSTPQQPRLQGCGSCTRDARRNHVQRGSIVAKPYLSEGGRSSGCHLQSSAGAKWNIHHPLPFEFSGSEELC